MELELKNGDYLPDGAGGLRRVGGREALLQRALFRLTARRGSFPFWESLGSRLWELGRVPAHKRQSAARQYVTEALAEEPVTVENVTLDQGPSGAAAVTAAMTNPAAAAPLRVAAAPRLRPPAAPRVMPVNPRRRSVRSPAHMKMSAYS